MKKRLLSMLMVIAMVISLLPTAAWATNISGTISSNVTWNDGDVIDSAVTLSGGSEGTPMVVTVSGTVTVNAEICVTGNVRITGGGKLVRSSSYTSGNMLTVFNYGSLILDNITVDGNNVSISSGQGIYVNSNSDLIINEGAVLKNHTKSNSTGSVLYVIGHVVMNGGVIESNSSTSYGNIYLDNISNNHATFTMNEGTIRNNQLTSTTSSYGGGAFYLRDATLTVNGGTISDHTNIPSNGGAIYCSSYGKVYLNGGSIINNSTIDTYYSSYYGDAIYFSAREDNGATLYIGGNVYISDSIFLYRGTSTSKYPDITSTIKTPLTLEVDSYTPDRIIAVGHDYTLTESDMAKITLKTTDGTTYYSKLDSTNNRLLMTNTDPGYTEKHYVTYLGNGGTGSTLDDTAYNSGQTATVMDNGFQCEGYTFSCWNTKADGTGTSYTPGGSISMSEDVTLYAIWQNSNTPPVTTYDLWVGGVQITEANKNNVDGTNTVRYDPNTCTLALDNYSYTGEGYQYKAADESESPDARYAAIYSEGIDLNIKLVGSNNISCTGHTISEGIFTNGGALTIYGTDKTTDKLTVTSTSNDITSDGTLRVEAVTITVNTPAVTDIYIGSDIIINNSIMEADCLVAVPGAMTITDSTVSAAAILSSGETKIINSSVELSGAINVDDSVAIIAIDGLTIKNSNVKALNTTVASDNLYDVGIRARNFMSVTNSTVEAFGADNAICVITDSDEETTPTLNGALSVWAGNSADSAALVVNPTVETYENKYIKIESAIFTVSLQTNGGTIADGKNVTSYTYGTGATLPIAGDMTKSNHRFDGWYEDSAFSGSPVPTISTTATGNKTYYAKWTEMHTASGSITGCNGTTYTGVPTATLVALGGESVNATLTSNDGIGPWTYSATVPADQYNLVVTATESGDGGKTVTVTSLVDLTAQDASRDLTLPTSTKSSTVKASGNSTPKVIAGGVDKIAANTNVPTGASTITIELTVDEKAKNAVTDDATKIESVAGGQKIDLYLDIQLTLYKDAEPTGTDLGSTNTQILELIVPADTSKTGLTVYRVHNGVPEAMKKDSADASGEYFKIGNGFITIYAKKFSVYAIGYTPENTYTITLDANGGTVIGGSIATLVTGTDKKLTDLPTPTHGGSYTFNGWYTAASGGDAVTAGKVYTGNDTIYAQWTYTGSTGGGGSYTPTYAIAVEKAENGTVKANRTYTSSGSTVTITATPKDGYVVDTVTVTDSQGNKIEVTVKSDGTYTFKMPSRKVTVEATFVSDGSYATCTGDSSCPMYGYTDLDCGAWYHDGVHYAIDNGLMSGYGNNIFKPDADTTRAMITVMLWRLNGSPVVNYALDFEDVEEGKWYTEAIRWAKSEGIAGGYGNGYFGTNDAITREQMVTILWRYAQQKNVDVSVGENTNILSFEDAFDVAEYAIHAMQWACGSGVVGGKNNADGTGLILDPDGKGTRAQIATMMMRFCEEIAK